MNVALKVGLLFQVIQFGLIGFVGLIWVLMNMNITPIALLIFMWACLNIASLILIVNGTVRYNQKD